MNTINSIIRILEIPPLKSYNNILRTKFRAELPYVRNKVEYHAIVDCTIWGELACDLVNYYHINDYALIEGYVLTLPNSKENQSNITLNIVRLYPFLFKFEISN